MNEKELNTIMGVVSDPIHNVYPTTSRKDIEEIQRIIRIFNINNEQKIRHKLLSIKKMATFRLVMTNN